MSEITYKQSYIVKFPLRKCLQVRVDRIWQVVGGCARSKRNPKRPYRQLWAPCKSIHSWSKVSASGKKIYIEYVLPGVNY